MSAVEARITDTGQGLGVYHIHFLVAGSWEACTIPGSSKSIRALVLLCVGRAAGRPLDLVILMRPWAARRST